MRKEYLYYPLYYSEKHTNGCGPKGFGWLVPDWWGISFEEACNIHDSAYYYYGAILKTLEYSEKIRLEGKSHADKTMLYNMMLINEHESPTTLGKWLRKPIIYLYYIGVKYFGEKHFLGLKECYASEKKT